MSTTPSVKLQKSAPKVITNTQASQVLKLHIAGLSERQIGKQLGINHNTVHKIITKHVKILNLINKNQELGDIKQQLIENSVLELIKSAVSKADDDRATVNGCAFAAKTIWEIGRVERNLSTANIAICNFTSLPSHAPAIIEPAE